VGPPPYNFRNGNTTVLFVQD